MKKTIRIVLLVLLLAGLSALLMFRIRGLRELGLLPPQDSAVPAAAPISATAAPEPEPEPTPEPAPRAEAREFTISIIGDQTLTSHQFLADSSPYSYAGRMKDDYAYPFHNTVQYFTADDYTISNLECTLSDNKLKSAMQFYFKAPTAYANILIEGGVDFVTTANNHMLDFGEQGLQDTYAALEEYGIPYGKEDEAQIVTTDSGLVLGIYCAYNDLHPDADRAAEAIRQLRDEGAEYVICCFHWGQELYYHPNQGQIDLAHACIDAGADLIYGTHTHCLQPIEDYNGGIILYSMGNWSFGGSSSPKDKDTAIVQIQVRRDENGVISNRGYTIVPCCVSSRPILEAYSGDNYNDYCPTPYTIGSNAFNRVLSKLDGSFQAESEGRDYSDIYASYS